jgi:hypothetical protein
MSMVCRITLFMLRKSLPVTGLGLGWGWREVDEDTLVCGNAAFGKGPMSESGAGV